MRWALVGPIQLQSAQIKLALNARDAMPTVDELQFTIRNILIDDG